MNARKAFVATYKKKLRDTSADLAAPFDRVRPADTTMSPMRSIVSFFLTFIPALRVFYSLEMEFQVNPQRLSSTKMPLSAITILSLRAKSNSKMYVLSGDHLILLLQVDRGMDKYLNRCFRPCVVQ